MVRREFEGKAEKMLMFLGNNKKKLPLFYFFDIKDIGRVQEKDFEFVLGILETEIKYKQRLSNEKLYESTFTYEEKIDLYLQALTKMKKDLNTGVHIDKNMAWPIFTDRLCSELKKCDVKAVKQLRLDEKAAVDELESMFIAFWQYYPKKAAKQDAHKAFMKIHPNAELLADIMAGVEAHIKGEQWQLGKQHIPYASTFLNGKRWEDEIEPYTKETKPNSVRGETRMPDKLADDDYVKMKMYTVPTLKNKVG